MTDLLLFIALALGVIALLVGGMRVSGATREGVE